jgi:group I intron endonuclease
MKFYTYVHYRKDNKLPFYIGKGKGNRYLETSNRNKYWKNIVSKHGFESRIIEYFDYESEALEHEKLLIQIFRKFKFKLSNLTDGGEGCSGFTFSNEAKAKMSADRKGKFGKPHTAETKAKLSATKKGNGWNIGRSLSNEHKTKLSISKLKEDNPNFRGYVYATNLETGEVIKLCGRQELEAAGFERKCVYLCLNGKQKTHKGHAFYREQLKEIDNESK